MGSSTSHGIGWFPADIFQMLPSAASLSGFCLLEQQAAQAGATLRQLHLSDWQVGCYLFQQGWEILWWGHQYRLCPHSNFQGIQNNILFLRLLSLLEELLNILKVVGKRAWAPHNQATWVEMTREQVYCWQHMTLKTLIQKLVIW